jgi:drug/metabolite transporter (DMT)-like permease
VTPADRPAGVPLSPGTPRTPRTALMAADRRLVELAVLGVMVVWAGNFIVVKDVLSVMPPVGFTFLRYALASVTLLAILRVSEGRIRLPRPETWRIVILGGLGFGVYQILWTVGLQTIPAGDSALLIAATPVFTAVIAVLIGTDTLPPLKALGVVLSFVGVVVVVASGVGVELSGSPIGFALTLGAAFCWATYTAVGARLLRRHSPLVLTTWATIGGTAILAPVGIGQLLAPGAITADSNADVVGILLSVAYSGILAAALANIIVFHGVRMLGPTRVTTVQALVPALAVVLAFIFLGEPIRIGQVIGGAIIVGGVALTRLVSRRPATVRR